MSCRDAQRAKAIKVFPDLEPWELPHTCALDIADRGEHSLDDVGRMINVSAERVRQIEKCALLKVKQRLQEEGKKGDAMRAAMDMIERGATR